MDYYFQKGSYFIIIIIIVIIKLIKHFNLYLNFRIY